MFQAIKFTTQNDRYLFCRIGAAHSLKDSSSSSSSSSSTLYFRVGNSLVLLFEDSILRAGCIPIFYDYNSFHLQGYMHLKKTIVVCASHKIKNPHSYTCGFSF